MKKFAVVIVE